MIRQLLVQILHSLVILYHLIHVILYGFLQLRLHDFNLLFRLFQLSGEVFLESPMLLDERVQRICMCLLQVFHLFVHLSGGFSFVSDGFYLVTGLL